MGNIQVMNKYKSLQFNFERGARRESETNLQHLHKHFNDVSDGILRPETVHAYHLPSNFRENAKNNIFKLKLCKHGKSMVIAEQTVLSCRNCPENFQMVVSFVSNDNDADDNIESISRTPSS